MHDYKIPPCLNFNHCDLCFSSCCVSFIRNIAGSDDTGCNPAPALVVAQWIADSGTRLNWLPFDRLGFLSICKRLHFFIVKTTSRI